MFQLTGHHQAKLLQKYDMIYLLTAIGLSPSGRSTVHIYTQTIHRTIQNKQYIEQHNNILIKAEIKFQEASLLHITVILMKSTTINNKA